MPFDPDALLAALPFRVIVTPPPETPAPRLRGSPTKGPYNGFTARERGQTSALATWLQLGGWMAGPAACAVCSEPAKHTHAEDYFDLARWIDLCIGCHNALHKRFDQPGPWLKRLEGFPVGGGHWTRLVSPEPFDLAALVRARGVEEPTAAAMIARPRDPPPLRRPRQRFGEMGIPPGGRLIHPMAPALEVWVVDDRWLTWQGATHSLTSLTAALTQAFGLPTSRDLWTFEGRSLGAIYDETYGVKG